MIINWVSDVGFGSMGSVAVAGVFAVCVVLVSFGVGYFVIGCCFSRLVVGWLLCFNSEFCIYVAVLRIVFVC